MFGNGEYLSWKLPTHQSRTFFLQGIAFGKFQRWIKRSNQNIWVRSEGSTPELLEFPFMRKPRIATAPKQPDYIKMENFIYPDGGPFPVFLFLLRPKEIPASGMGNLISKQIPKGSVKNCPGSQLVGVPSDDREVTRAEQWSWRLIDSRNAFQCLVCSLHQVQAVFQGE